MKLTSVPTPMSKHGPKIRSCRERFYEKILIRPKTRCWVWTGTRIPRGYGMAFTSREVGQMPAHRVSYILHNGEIPAGLQVCHKCDNRACVNPEHLFLGTNKDNADDMDRKGRRVTSPGSRNGFSRLNEQQVADIRAQLLTGKRGLQRQLAKQYGVDPRTISVIKVGKAWRHVA